MSTSMDIAIVGASCRFPGADNIDVFWENLINGVESIKQFSKEELKQLKVPDELVNHSNYVPANGIINNVDMFDAQFFGFSPQEAKLTDPQRRLFLECCWEALESAGLAPSKCNEVIGVYATMLDSTYLQNNVLKNCSSQKLCDWLQVRITSSPAALSTQVSYRFNLTGPSINLATGCSTSLVATLQGCKDLLNYDCDIAMVGGSAIVVPRAGYLYVKDGMESPDGHCRAFDKDASGTVLSNGLGVIILKRLKDAEESNDNILAIIRGGNINNDGSDKLSFTAPSVTGQARCIAAALEFTDTDPESIDHIEAWGTGTQLGDPIEVEALTKAFRLKTTKKQYCSLGSVKTNIGHVDIAAGFASIIKVAMSLKKGIIPATLHYKNPNPHIDFNNSPFYVNSTNRVWNKKASPRRAGINAISIGGTNAFLILEEYIPAKKEINSVNSKNELIMISAKTKTALDKSIANLIQTFEQAKDQRDFSSIAYTLQVGRADFNFRRAVVCKNKEEAIERLTQISSDKTNFTNNINKRRPPKVVFMFSGQGSQYPGMARELYNSEPLFADYIDECLSRLSGNIKTKVYALLCAPKEKSGTSEKLDTRVVQPALFILEYALAKWFMELGIIPHAFIGHSLGELTAACVAEVMDLEQALNIVLRRSELMSESAPGAMLAIELNTKDLPKYLKDSNVSIAAINTSDQCVVSGPIAEIENLERTLQSNDILVKRLRVSHAFHSTLMDPILESFKDAFSQIELQSPTLPIISNMTGDWAEDEEIASAEYWKQHLRNPVKFSQGIELLLTEEYTYFLEIGPGNTLSQLARNIVRNKEDVGIHESLSLYKDNIDSNKSLLNALGQFWLQGGLIHWNKLNSAGKSRRPIPTYPFERQRYWIDPDTITSDPDGKDNFRKEDGFFEDHSLDKTTLSPFVVEETSIEKDLKIIWQEALGLHSLSVLDDFIELGGHSFMMLRILSKVEEKFKIKSSIYELKDHKTIRDYAKMIEVKLQGHDEKIIDTPILLRKKGVGTPLFCLHPLMGEVLCFLELSKSLKYNCPIYGLRDPGQNTCTLAFDSLKTMATHYIENMQKIQKQGPYRLLGYSFGGSLAVEMAKQLGDNGEQVEFIILLDSWAKFSKQHYDPEYFKQAVLPKYPGFFTDRDFVELCFKRMGLLFQYQIPEISVPLILMKAETVLPEYSEINDNENHWGPYAKNGLTVYSIPGNHNTILGELNVVNLVKKIDEILMETKSAVHEF